MTIAQDRPAEIGIPGLVDRLLQTATELRSEERARAEERVPGFWERFEAALDYVNVVHSTANPALISGAIATQLRDQLTALRGYLATFAEGGDVEQIPQAQGHVDNLVSIAAAWPSRQLDHDAISAAATQFRRSVAAQLRSIKKSLEDVSDSTGAKVLELNERLIQATEEVDRLQSRVDETISRQEGQFSDSQEERRREWAETLSALKKAADGTRGEVESKSNSLLEYIEKRATQSQSNLDDQEKAARDLVGAISVTGTSHAYGKEGKEQGHEANVWRIAALSLLGIAATVSVVLLFVGSLTDASHVAAKILAGLALLGGAGYAASQSKTHRDREAKARLLEIQLIAFGPFVQDLLDDERIAARVNFVDRAFGATVPTVLDGQGAISDDTVSVFRHLLEALKKYGS